MTVVSMNWAMQGLHHQALHLKARIGMSICILLVWTRKLLTEQRCTKIFQKPLIKERSLDHINSTYDSDLRSISLLRAFGKPWYMGISARAYPHCNPNCRHARDSKWNPYYCDLLSCCKGLEKLPQYRPTENETVCKKW